MPDPLYTYCFFFQLCFRGQAVALMQSEDANLLASRAFGARPMSLVGYYFTWIGRCTKPKLMWAMPAFESFLRQLSPSPRFQHWFELRCKMPTFQGALASSDRVKLSKRGFAAWWSPDMTGAPRSVFMVHSFAQSDSHILCGLPCSLARAQSRLSYEFIAPAPT